ncbi:ABC-type glycerol-3-phosphate transport system permease component [Rhizobium mesoamericanum]|nr:ABC-type glycerol-3-phosphate transport system permease component [Rhizobium mesoamericanum]
MDRAREEHRIGGPRPPKRKVTGRAAVPGPVGVLTELVRGDVFEWGALMAGALFGLLPVVTLYSFFVDYYVSSMTGAVKE